MSLRNRPAASPFISSSIGGASPVATFNGKLVALASGRPLRSFRPGGSSIVKAARSGNRPLNCTSPRCSALSSLSNAGASAGPPAAGFRRTWAASARGTGVEKRSTTGRIGKHGALARSRSHENSAVKGARTR